MYVTPPFPLDHFKTAVASAAGNTALWTPAAGKSFRLCRYFIQMSENSTLGAAGILTIKLLDGATDLNLTTDFYVPAAAVTGIGTEWLGPVDLGDSGILSAAPNNVLNVNLSVALATGQVRVIAMGTEQ